MTLTITPTHTAASAADLTELGNELGDDLLLSAVAGVKISKVKAGNPSTARAWSYLGNVD